MFDDVALPIIRQKLIDDLGYAEHEVVVHVDGRVHAKHGIRQINLYPSILIPGGSDDQHVGQEYVSGFNIGITRRVSRVPPDKTWAYAYANDVLNILRGIMWTIRKRRYNIIAEINQALSLQPAPDVPAPFYPWKLVEPYRLVGDTAAITEVGPEHFHADLTDSDVRTDYGYFIAVKYAAGRYMANAHPDVSGLAALAQFGFVVDEELVDFTADAYGQAPLSYFWDFGDGTTSTEENPTHEYVFSAASATFTVTLTIVTADNQESTATQDVTLFGTSLELCLLTIVELDNLMPGQINHMLACSSPGPLPDSIDIDTLTMFQLDNMAIIDLDEMQVT